MTETATLNGCRTRIGGLDTNWNAASCLYVRRQDDFNKALN